LGLFLRNTGLPSRSALVAPPLRLAALRWRGVFVVLGRIRPPPGGSAACLQAVARFSGRPFPGVPPLRMCLGEAGASAAHSQGPHARRGASLRAERARDSWALWSAKRGATVMGCDRGPRERCQATAGRFPARRVARPFQRRLASATRVWENLVRQQRPWACFFDTPACRRVRRSSRLRSGSPPCGGLWGCSSSFGFGHLRASRRPARWLWRASPGGHSRGCPP
jgi:hypothetical protein